MQRGAKLREELALSASNNRVKGNVTFLVLISIAAVFVAVFVLPYLQSIGHPLVAIPIFAFLALLFIYGRHNPQPRRPPRRQPPNSSI